METAAETRFRVGALRIVSLVAAAFALALVVWGGIVRINGAGMTCPDWPRCRGAWFPALDNPVMFEWVHRLGAPILTVLIIATFAAAWRARRDLPAALVGSWFALSMIVAQIFVGWLTIKYANGPPSVAAHLVVGVATFVSLALAALIAWRPQTQPSAQRLPSYIPWLALAATLATFIAVGAGGFMSASGAGAACVGFPLCDGWKSASGAMQRIHMDHRFAAYIAFALVAATFAALIPLRRAHRDLVWAAGTAFALAALQIALGIGAVLSGLQPALRSIHQANGALLAASLTALTYLAFAQLPAGLEQANRYLTLTKPKVMSLLLFTTLMSMMIAKSGLPSVRLVIATLLGGALAAGAAGAINMVLDRDIDARMTRTAKRPIPSGQIPAAHALAFGVALTVLSFAVLATIVNLLSAVLAFVGIVYYVFVYTVWLKRWTPQNIVIGGAAGAIPPLVGWAAVTNHIGLTAALLFLIVFVWTPPHFWALSLMAKEQYAKAGVPMLPVVRGDAETKRQILWYTVVLIGLTLAAVPLRMMGTLYLACALALDAAFLFYSVRVVSIGSIASERTLYKFSMLYLALLFAAMVVDRIARGTGV